MDDTLRVFVDQLKGGKTKEINLTIAAEQVALDKKALNQDNELVFDQPISVLGQAYLAQDELVLHLNVSTEVTVPCNICNDMILVPLKVNDLYICQALEDIKGAVLDLAPLIREELLLNLPQFSECEGKCPKRKEIQPFLKKKSLDEDEDKYHPFADL